MSKYLEALHVDNIKNRSGGIWLVRHADEIDRGAPLTPLTCEPAEGFSLERVWNGPVFGAYRNLVPNKGPDVRGSRGHSVLFTLRTNIRPDLHDERLPADYVPCMYGTRLSDLYNHHVWGKDHLFNGYIAETYFIWTVAAPSFVINIYTDGMTELNVFEYTQRVVEARRSYDISVWGVKNKLYGSVQTMREDTVFNFYGDVHKKVVRKTFIEGAKWLPKVDFSRDTFRVNGPRGKFGFVFDLWDLVYNVHGARNGRRTKYGAEIL